MVRVRIKPRNHFLFYNQKKLKEKPNFSVIDKMSDNSSEVRELLLNIIKEEFPLEKKLYYEQLQLKNYKKIQEIVHKIKHKINALGLEKSYVLANKYEKNLINESLDLSEEFDEILITISNFVDTL